MWGVVAFAAGYVFAAPYLTAYQMKTAVENFDGEALSERIDFPSLRQSLKDQANAMLGKEFAEKMTDGDGFATLGAVLGISFGGAMAEKMIDVYVTPASVMDLMKGEKPKSESAGGPVERRQAFAEISMGYESLDKFSMTTEGSGSDDEVKLVFRREGITEWKLTEVLLPSLDLP